MTSLRQCCISTTRKQLGKVQILISPNSPLTRAMTLIPTVLESGEIIFSRWDRAQNNDQISLYRINPNGRDLSLLYGHHSEDSGSAWQRRQILSAPGNGRWKPAGDSARRGQQTAWVAISSLSIPIISSNTINPSGSINPVTMAVPLVRLSLSTHSRHH